MYHRASFAMRCATHPHATLVRYLRTVPLTRGLKEYCPRAPFHQDTFSAGTRRDHTGNLACGRVHTTVSRIPSNMMLAHPSVVRISPLTTNARILAATGEYPTIGQTREYAAVLLMEWFMSIP